MPKERPIVMIVDDNVANLKLGKLALTGPYDVFTIPSAAKMLDLLERKRPSLILLDIDMPDMDGYQAIERLKADPATADIPVIFLTALDHLDNELKGLALGAVDYVAKPFQPALLRQRVQTHLTIGEQRGRLEAQRLELRRYNLELEDMVQAKSGEVLELQIAILKTMADLVESRDDITGAHQDRTQRGLSVMLDALGELGLHRDEIETWDEPLVLKSSLLHDVGKIAISDAILKKPGPLTPEEFETMKLHTVYGVAIIGKIQSYASESAFLSYAKVLAGTHHERWDGKGYPEGLAGEDIPLKGRLMALVDVYDALVAQRPYKPAFPKEEAVKLIVADRGSRFDPVLVDVFQQVADRF
jgi:putative two-component system response regulator